MIIDFSIKNFASIKDEICLSFEADKSKDLEAYYISEPKKGLRLLKLGVIFGANASGKTTILKALSFLRDMVMKPFDKKTVHFDYTPFLFSDTTAKEPTRFSLRFIHQDTEFHYTLVFNKTHIVEEQMDFYAPNKALLFKRSTQAEKQLSEIKFGSKITIPKAQQAALEANTLWNNTVLAGCLKTNIESEELQKVLDWFQHTLKPLITPKTDLIPAISVEIENGSMDKALLLSYLQKADLKITGIEIIKKEIPMDKAMVDMMVEFFKDKSIAQEEIEKGKMEVRELYFQHSILNGDKVQNFTLPYNAESDGTLRYYVFCGLLTRMAKLNRIFPIDELEASLHPDLLVHFLLAFLKNTQNSQLIVSSHYRELLMEKDMFRPDVIWFTEKKADGGTSLFSLSDFGTTVVRDTSSYYNAYKLGKLGATPDLSDPFNSLMSSYNQQKNG